ncbi:unnamed protein product [Penicillium salamii]|uniref:Serum paraoxonase/arylesterase family protein n=1 Tax=Penicillium salamii TaxID=1612424 RepID=A0A9W4N970_9EURO|nr:unnamed protein product [Penicillium salamii]CAG8094753.1 unnamed protein product [Penicillium salamii]CAG8253783.1 unnamed protein product [Penicillium salamii]CAG8254497.1 unnamed protein product [Penicillium salamii]CAG8306161.1 unnamed protein product [Penicillium salamii]
MGLSPTLKLGLFAALVSYLAGPVSHIVRISGVFLTPNPTVLGEGQGPIYIADTVHCEDVHHYRPANLLFTACEDHKSTRFSWFPPLGHMAQPSTRGSLHVVDPKTMKSSRLAFSNFEGPFTTHGIDVIEDPDANAVYIFAVNHLPNPAYFEAGEPEGVHKARSQIELFHHVLGSSTAQHVRSIYHPLVETPNDVYAESPVSFYVTNDHFYRDGVMRMVEDLWPSAKWSNIIHVQVDNLSKEGNVNASVALTGLWNNNGLGHGRTDKEMIISSAVGGELYVSAPQSNRTIEIQETIPFETVTDNPSYYADPYRTDDDDASGFVVAGISQAIYLPTNAKNEDATDASQVWYTRFLPDTSVWERKLLFEDDGLRIRTASAAVLVPIEPKGGKKLAWLFVTGFMSENMIAVQVEL